eukprot:5641420-Prymnesium_polylepis.1
MGGSRTLKPWTLITYALPSPPPGRSPWALLPRVDRYGIGVDTTYVTGLLRGHLCYGIRL